MKAIELDMIEAITAGRDFIKSNTYVEWLPLANQSPSAMHDPGKVARVYLHGNLIGEYNPGAGVLAVTDAGWQSNVTKSRINALLLMFDADRVLKQVEGTWYMVHFVDRGQGIQRIEWPGVDQLTLADKLSR